MTVLDLRKEGKAWQPLLDDLPDLTEEERAMAARTWRGRMVNEHISAQVFAGLVPQLMRAGLPSAIQTRVPRMISDELRHAEQCAGVVLALGHTPVAPLPPIVPIPTHDDAEPLEAVLRNVISVCCMSETVAVSVISAEHFELKGTTLGGVLEKILADEIQHARFGWELIGALVPRLPADVKERLSAYLEDALAHQVDYEVPRLPVNLGVRDEVAQAGVCDGGEARALFIDTVETVIVPRLEDAGLSARAAWDRVRASHRLLAS